MRQLHIHYDDAEYRQLRFIAVDKGVTISSLVRSYIQRGINDDLIPSTTTLGKSAKHPFQLQAKQTVSPPIVIFQEQQEQKHTQFIASLETQSKYPKPVSNSELDEWHRGFFAECFLEVREPFFDNPRGLIGEPSLLMAIATKAKLIKGMLEKEENQKLFRVHNALVLHIVEKMHRSKIISTVSRGGHVLACPMMLLEHFIKKGSMISSSGSDIPQADTRSIPDCDRTSNLQNQTYSCHSPIKATATPLLMTDSIDLNRNEDDATIDVDEKDSIVMDDNDYSVLDDNADITEVDN
jgi:hypothetical protein